MRLLFTLVLLMFISSCQSSSIISKNGMQGFHSLGQPKGKVIKWTNISDIHLNPKNNKILVPSFEEGQGVIYNGGRCPNLLTENEYGDVQAHFEFMVAKRSNSGIYFMGKYEIQILDSFGKKKVGFGDCGGIYQRYENKKGFEGRGPLVNAAKAPGQWQTYDITFKAPRFDKDGKKTANAKFVKVVLNGKTVQENQEVTGTTRSGMRGKETATGPIMFQGDHGQIAFRNIRIKKLN